MSPLEHPVSHEELMAYADGQLQPQDQSRVATHLEECPDCAAVVADIKHVSQQMAAWQVEESPEKVRQFVLATMGQPFAGSRSRGSRSGFWSRGRSWAYGMVGAFAVLVLLMFAATPSLLRSKQAAPSVSTSPIAPQGTTRAAQAEVPSSAMVIRNVKLILITKEFDAARAKIEVLVQQTRGYIDHLNVSGEAGSARRLFGTLRLPANQLEAGLVELRKLGQLKEEAQNNSDITSQYVDLGARLANARNSEQRLLALLRDRAGDLKDVVAMEREIASVRENIERMEAQQKDLNNRVQYATIQLEIAEQYHAELESPVPSTGTELRNALVDGIRSATDNAIGIVLFLLRYGPSLLIWVAALAPLAWLLWRKAGSLSSNPK